MTAFYRPDTGHAEAAHLLVVDDNALNLRLLNDILLTKGYQVTLASSGPEALEAAQRALFDLVLMDVQMPVMSGTEAMRQLKSRADWRGAPILAVTALVMQGDDEELLAAGFDGYISKPVTYGVMLETVASHLASHLSPYVARPPSV